MVLVATVTQVACSPHQTSPVVHKPLITPHHILPELTYLLRDALPPLQLHKSCQLNVVHPSMLNHKLKQFSQVLTWVSNSTGSLTISGSH